MFNLMTFEERVNFYLGYNFVNSDKININDYENIYTIDMLTDNIDQTINNIDKSGMNFTYRFYDYSIKSLLIKTKNIDKKFKFKRGDISYKETLITLVKNRCINNNDSVLLRCLNFDRHWKEYYDKPIDVTFEEKQPKIFWRGTTTGQPYYIGNRFDLVTKWYIKHPDIDVGFNKICQNKNEYAQYVKGHCKSEEFLKYKYIISVEGNDKDSGINWKLNSNSLVLMPRPRVTSWLMETTLIPNFHYVLLKDDFSDLAEKLEWCNNNQDECKQIIKNANHFMSQFADAKREEELEEEVIRRYFEKIIQ